MIIYILKDVFPFFHPFICNSLNCCSILDWGRHPPDSAFPWSHFLCWITFAYAAVTLLRNDLFSCSRPSIIWPVIEDPDSHYPWLKRDHVLRWPRRSDLNRVTAVKGWYCPDSSIWLAMKGSDSSLPEPWPAANDCRYPAKPNQVLSQTLNVYQSRMIYKYIMKLIICFVAPHLTAFPSSLISPTEFSLLLSSNSKTAQTLVGSLTHCWRR